MTSEIEAAIERVKRSRIEELEVALQKIWNMHSTASQDKTAIVHETVDQVLKKDG